MSYFMRVGNMKWDELWGETYSVVPQGKFAGKKSAAHSRSRNNDNYPEDKRQITLSSRTSGSRWEIQVQKNRRKSQEEIAPLHLKLQILHASWNANAGEAKCEGSRNLFSEKKWKVHERTTRTQLEKRRARKESKALGKPNFICRLAC